MKDYIEDLLFNYSSIFPTTSKVIEYTFATLGTGVRLNSKGYIRGYTGTEPYTFPEPEALDSIYQWSDNERFQPFRMLAGCRNPSFK
jgi:hypothetical protein